MVLARQKAALLRDYQSKKELINKRLSEIVAEISDSRDGDFAEALGYTLIGGGKRIRAALAMSVYDLLDGTDNKALDAACAVELLQASSLMLDDLPSMDNATMRRGNDSAHLRFSESTTILAAAALWTKAYELLAAYPARNAVNLVKLTAELTGAKGLVLGQYYDLESKQKALSLDELIRQYGLKTASMFRLAVGFGAILGDADEAQSTALDGYAHNLGIAFQVHDDILDATMTMPETGKDAHLDDVNKKQNFVSTVGLEASEDQFYEFMKKADEELSKTGLNVDRIRNFTSNLLG